jgi:hypothetical protein
MRLRDRPLVARNSLEITQFARTSQPLHHIGWGVNMTRCLEALCGGPVAAVSGAAQHDILRAAGTCEDGRAAGEEPVSLE